jgi:endoglucanase
MTMLNVPVPVDSSILASVLTAAGYTVTAPSAQSTALAIKVSGGKLIDQNGKVVQLRGVNVAGLEGYAIQNQPWMNQDPWAGRAPVFSAIKSWAGVNAVRFTLNEASWLALTTYDWPVAPATVGVARKADPWGNYKAVVKAAVDGATAAGLYVILDMHLNAPNAIVPGIAGKVPITPIAQNPMADADNSISFWTSLASAYKGYPNVIFDLFNEPHIDGFVGVTGSLDVTAWAALRDGGMGTSFQAGVGGATGQNVTVSQNWASAGTQAMLNAVRAAGATNVVMSPGLSWALNMAMWVKYAPVDPLKQLAASWHGYASTTNNLVPAVSTSFTDVQAILAAGYPVIIGETGDFTAAGAATWLPILLPWANTNGVSVLVWTWDAWGQAQFNLILDSTGTPTPGEGAVVKGWAST